MLEHRTGWTVTWRTLAVNLIFFLAESVFLGNHTRELIQGAMMVTNAFCLAAKILKKDEMN